MNRKISTSLVLAALLILSASGRAADTNASADAAPIEGNPAPDFRLQDQNSEWHRLEDYRDRWIVLYFYPKDDTPGCTTEACNFRDDIYRFKAKGAVVLGVSLDDVDSHREFAEKYELPFPLLSDVDKEAARKYDVLATLGPLTFTKRQTFLIDPQGRIAKHYEDVDPKVHAGQVLADLDALMAGDKAL